MTASTPAPAATAPIPYPTTSAGRDSASSSEPVRCGGRLQDPVWNDVFVADGVVSCKKCEKIIHTSGNTHVEHVLYHYNKKCVKTTYTPAITPCFRPAISQVTVTAFKRQVALWFDSTGMAFHKAAHPSLAAAIEEPTSTAVVFPSKQLETMLLDKCYEEIRAATMLKLRDKRCTLVTDAWMYVNGKSVVDYVALYDDYSVFLESVYMGSVARPMKP